MDTSTDDACKVLDRKAAMALLGIDAQSLESLIGIFRKELGEWTDFFTTVVGGDPVTMRSKAHRLKGDAANVGAMRVQRAAETLETAVHDKATDAVIEAARSDLVKALWELTEELE